MKFLKDLKSVLNLTVIVAGLGYFVDLFDITLFGVVRRSSLEALGYTGDALLKEGVFIYNSQMAGMMVGGVVWGMLADKKGRLSVMFGSILLYSLANFANAFVWDANSYALCRFLGGVGLAGELGAAITLVAESLPKEKRGLGTTIVATLGMFGIVAAALVGQHLDWKTAYVTGGLMGIALLFTRFKISESGVFTKSHSSEVSRGNPLVIFTSGKSWRYICCILIGVPVYFSTGVLMTFAPELTAGLNVEGAVSAGNAILFGSIGLTIGDLASGLVSQYLRSRRKAVAAFLASGLLITAIYLNTTGLTSGMVYGLTFAIGLCVGYWAVLVTMAAEQFGTNIRGTVATTVPNFVRGSAIFAASGFAYLKGTMTAGQAALTVGVICFGAALLALTQIEETFGRDLDFDDRQA
ncbi:MAG: MFS transporter [Bdellovibrionota bacterium]